LPLGSDRQTAHEQPPSLTEADVAAVQAMVADLPTLWRAPGTTPQDRQKVIRRLVERIVITVLGRSERVEVTIHWAGGATSRHEALRSIGKYEDLSDYANLRARVVQLHQAGHTTAGIAELLTREGFHTPRCDRPFNEQMVYVLMHEHFVIETGLPSDRAWSTDTGSKSARGVTPFCTLVTIDS
jgi:hypothetical protein